MFSNNQIQDNYWSSWPAWLYSRTVYQEWPKWWMIVKSQWQQASWYIIIVQACPDNNFAWETVWVMLCSSQCILDRTLTVPILPNRYYVIPWDVWWYVFYE